MTEDIRHICAYLANGGIGVMPTDTVFGIVARAADPAAVARVDAVKGRTASAKMPIVLITHTAQMLQLCPSIPPSAVARAEQLWAWRGDDAAYIVRLCGAQARRRGVSVIVPCHDAQLAYLHKGSGGIAFRRITENTRTPDTNRLYDVITAVGPVIATSANRSGEDVVTHGAQARALFGDACDFYVSGTSLPATHPSMVVRLDVSPAAPLTIVRR